MPDDSFETAECLTTTAQLKKVAVESIVGQAQAFVEHHIKQHASDYDWMKRANAWINSLRELCPAAKEISALENKVATMLEEIANAEKQRLAELEAKKEEAAKLRNETSVSRY